MTIERRTIAVLVDNEPGVLARVIGLFAGRGYNIESLTVSAVDAVNNLSRITVVTLGTAQTIEQIKAQLDRIVPVHRVLDLTKDAPGEVMERELALIKVNSTGEQRVESLRLADISGAKVVDAGLEHFTFEMAGRPQDIDRFIDLMGALGLSDISRTGVVAIARGSDGLGILIGKETDFGQKIRS